MKIQSSYFLAALLFAFSGCATKVSFVSPQTHSIVLKEPQTAGFYITDKVQFPVGIYEPDFQSEEGIYYRTPTKLIAGPMGMTMIRRGGLFVPFPSAKDQRHGVWFDHQEGSGGLLVAFVTSPKKVWRLKQQIVFEQSPQ